VRTKDIFENTLNQNRTIRGNRKKKNRKKERKKKEKEIKKKGVLILYSILCCMIPSKKSSPTCRIDSQSRSKTNHMSFEIVSP
jgi:hypothetical protein